MARKLDLKGQRFGRLSVVSETAGRRHGQVIWSCVCDCGSEVEVQAGNLRSANTQSCGCLQKERAAACATRHGRSRVGDRAYTAWASMHARCKYESTYAYPWYGGKGIRVCAQWTGPNGFETFASDMGEHPGEGWSIDRLDPGEDYAPENCRWLPISENSRRARAAY